MANTTPMAAPLDFKRAGSKRHEPFNQDWQTLNSASFADLSKQDEFGSLEFITEDDLPFMWVLIDCSQCTDVTYVKHCPALSPFDNTTDTFEIPAGERFSFGLNGARGADGGGVTAIALALQGGMSGDVAKITAFFDDK